MISSRILLALLILTGCTSAPQTLTQSLAAAPMDACSPVVVPEGPSDAAANVVSSRDAAPEASVVAPRDAAPEAAPVSNSYAHRMTTMHTDVWCLGDSITYGSGTTPVTGYRKPLWQWMTAQGFNFDFVGSAHVGDGTYDPDANGHPGATIAAATLRVHTEYPGHVPHVTLTVLLIGVNDMGFPGSGFAANYDPIATPQAYAALLTKLPSAALVSTLTPAQNPTIQANINDFNSKLPAIWDSYDASHVEKLVRADAAAAFGAWSSANFYDGIHPNPAGYQKLAAAWEAGLQR